MPEDFDEKFKDLCKEDVGMLEIYYQIADDFRMDHPECPVRYSRMLARGGINRSYICRMIRREMETYWRTGDWRKQQD